MSLAQGAMAHGYRKDIDGLRAVAVLAVVLFHINPAWMPGGFVGVDVFFVISGFLISQQLYRNIHLNRFSLLDFYQRRIKRIAPAMLVVTAVTVLLSQLLFRPEDAVDVAKSGVAALFSMANVYFWLFQDTSYFAASSLEIPLLHLWSLGVEEQFYMVWPLLLLAFAPHLLTRRFGVVLILAALLSYALAQYVYSDSPSQAYYMLHTRAGELLLGALAAYLTFKYPISATITRLHRALRLTGYVLILYSLITLTEHDVFPGWNALPSTLGAALILLSGHYGRDITVVPLEWRVITFFGLISYSLYLWHWPVMAFYHYANLQVTPLTGAGLFVLMTFLGWLSYRMVETPFRYTTMTTGQVMSRLFVVPTCLLSAVFILAYANQGYGFRNISDYNGKVAAVNKQVEPANRQPGVCQVPRRENMPDLITSDKCVLSQSDALSPRVFMLGDSNAAHYVGMITPYVNERGLSVRTAMMGACPPLPSLTDINTYAEPRRRKDCADLFPEIWAASEAYDGIIISANWLHYEKGKVGFMQAFEQALFPLLERSKPILIIGKAPEFKGYDRWCREKAISFPLANCHVEDAPIFSGISEINAKLMALAARFDSLYYVDFSEQLCQRHGATTTCSVYRHDGTVMYFDNSHLSRAASWEIGQHAKEALREKESVNQFIHAIHQEKEKQDVMRLAP